jgi:hypothetical protein
MRIESEYEMKVVKKIHAQVLEDDGVYCSYQYHCAVIAST